MRTVEGTGAGGRRSGEVLGVEIRRGEAGCKRGRTRETLLLLMININILLGFPGSSLEDNWRMMIYWEGAIGANLTVLEEPSDLFIQSTSLSLPSFRLELRWN